MKPPVETVRISQRSRDILVKLKRKTGIEHWNVLCRWAFCASLSHPSRPVTVTLPDSNVEMSWKVFAGSLSETLPAILVLRARQDGVSHEREPLAEYFKNHLERGISHIQNTKDLVDLLKRVSTYSIPA
jgi:DNA sulfur modification protein DndE